MTALSLSELLRERPIARRRALIVAADETREDIASACAVPRQEPALRRIVSA